MNKRIKRVTIALDAVVVAKLDTIVQISGHSRAELLEAMIEMDWESLPAEIRRNEAGAGARALIGILRRIMPADEDEK